MSRFKNSIIVTLVIVALFAGKSMLAFQTTGHEGHDHAGHDHNKTELKKADDHAGHDHGSHAGHDHAGHDHAAHAGGDHTAHGVDANGCPTHPHEFFDAGHVALHHIADAHTYSIGPWNFPLPCIFYSGGDLTMFSSSKFNSDAHGAGSMAFEGYALDNSAAIRVTDPTFPKGHVEVAIVHKDVKNAKGKAITTPFVCYQGKIFPADKASTADFGLFGGGFTSFYDFSITKNVVAMLIVFSLLAWLFIGIARKYAANPGTAPSGVQGLIEPIFIFIQDEVAKPFLGDKYEKHLPLLMSLFFFILGLNLFGQIPFLGNANPTGNLAVTMVLAIITFIVTNINGNKHYWEHIFWMPGVPAWVKIILTPVEIIGLFIKPITLMLRLFANITAGHMVMVIFVGLIFIFGQAEMAPSLGSAVGATALTIFMMAIELLVAFIQAFVFTILTASYIGAAIEDHGHAAH